MKKKKKNPKCIQPLYDMSAPSWQAYCMGDFYLEQDPEVSKAIYFQKQKLSYSKSALKENWTSVLFSG